MSNWLTYSPVSGHGNGTITITADTQSSIEDRVATIIASNSQYGVSDSVLIKQLKESPTLLTPLTFNILSAGTINWSASSTSIKRTINYKLNDGEWTSITSNTSSSAPKINVVAGDKIQFRGNNATYSTSSSYYNTFGSSTAEFEVEGNIMSLINSTDFSTVTTLQSDYTFKRLFYGCTGLTSAENLILPATALSEGCYSVMFADCTSLTAAPKLPATILAEGCYNSMFYGCTSLTTAPALSAITLADYCYVNMFVECTSLTTAPSLPATTLASGCYESMFDGCTSLTAVPSNYLPVTTLTSGCYQGMFSNCSSLTTAPELPATTLADYCYSHMFSNCTSLTTAPELPATTLAGSCYNEMFYGTNILPDCSNIDFASSTVVASGGLRGLFSGTKVTDNDLERILPKNDNGRYYLPATTLADSCYQYMFMSCTSLTTAPELPATTLASSCYYYMFGNCTSLTTTPELPATTLADSCYSEMFQGCTSLTTAPALPATTLADYCYEYMFDGCSSLSYIKCLATDISAYRCTDYWANGVASTGTFVKNPNMTSWATGDNGIPSGWTVTNAS